MFLSLQFQGICIRTLHHEMCTLLPLTAMAIIHPMVCTLHLTCLTIHRRHHTTLHLTCLTIHRRHHTTLHQGTRATSTTALTTHRRHRLHRPTTTTMDTRIIAHLDSSKDVWLLSAAAACWRNAAASSEKLDIWHLGPRLQAILLLAIWILEHQSIN